jgi:hypothetical protein
VLDQDSICFRMPFDALTVRTRRIARPQTASEKRDAQRAVSCLRFGLEAREPHVLDGVQRLMHVLDGHGSFGFRALDASPLATSFAEELCRRIATEFERGRLVAEFQELLQPRERDQAVEVELPPLPPAKADQLVNFFDVRFVDEIGQGIPGLEVEFTVDGEIQTKTTNAAGVALLEGVKASSATVTVPDPAAAEQILEPRWVAPRPGKLPPESNSSEFLFEGGKIPSLGLRAALPHRVVLKPPLGKLFVELYDKSGQTRHVETKYTIDGPQSFSGKTDKEGRLVHPSVVPGNYTLKLEVEIVTADGTETDTFETPLVVLAQGEGVPEVRRLGAIPRIVLARVGGSVFPANKSFLLPGAVAALTEVSELYFENDPSDLLVVAHAGAGEAEPDALSLERAEVTLAFLKDEVDTWLALYEPNTSEARRWGAEEDRAMLTALPDFERKSEAEDPVRWFQTTRALKVDGIAGPETRKALVQAYMALDAASLSDGEFDITPSAHGCGANFPLEGVAREPELATSGERVELLFFDREFGVLPKAPGKNSTAGSAAYPDWEQRAVVIEFSAAGAVTEPADEEPLDGDEALDGETPPKAGTSPGSNDGVEMVA